MNDSASQHQREQSALSEFNFGDYITNAANNDSQHQSGLEVYSEFQHQLRNHPQMNLQSNMTSQNMLESHNRMDQFRQSQSQSIITAEMLNLKGRLEAQIKLQQLQQLQHQILQQQIELISGQPQINDQQKEAIFHGLLTPGPSAELPAIVPKDLVPPMMLQSDMYMNNSPSAAAIINQLSPHSQAVNPSLSAPAALAFPTSPPFPLPSPAQPGYDLSPLTSPWILPGSTAQQQHQTSQQLSPMQAHQRPRLKRTVSSSGDDQGGMRKRPSPSVNSPVSHSRRIGQSTSTNSSATSTPATLGMGSGAMQFLAPPNDTPSPVDLSMPPPAPPAANIDNPQASTSSTSSSATLSGSTSTSVSPDIAPMTPATILNLRRLSTGLIPSALSLTNTENKDTNVDAVSRKSNKGKSVVKPSVASSTNSTARGRKASVAKSGPSPSLKPLLPGAILPTPTSPLAQPSNSAHHPLSNFASNASSGSIHGPRKTSHKAAEQKRRDSLKTSFDELRLLLPPVPLLPEDGGDEPPLPGSMPPRGPPKGDADGPNRGVSKLALLRCGNTYIKELNEKVHRRDREIDKLRDEVRRLREVVGEKGTAGRLDLERDVDEGAALVTSGNFHACSVEESGVDGDEEGE